MAKPAVSITYPQHLPRGAARSLVMAADRLGYRGVWVPESYGFDALTTLADLAAHTERLRLASGIINVFSRSPALIAQSAASLDALSQGRFVLGLGASGPGVVQGWHGMPFVDGLQRLRETIEIVRMVLSGQRLRFEGTIFSIDGGLKLLGGPTREIPIYIGAISGAGARLAGEVGDGWLPGYVSPQHFQSHLKPQLHEGLRRGERAQDECPTCAFGVPVVITADRRSGRDAVRDRLALYIGGMGTFQKNFYMDLFSSYGFSAEARVVERLYRAGKKSDAAAALTDELIDSVCIVGTADECRSRLEDYGRLGIQEVAISIFGARDVAKYEDALNLLAPGA